ncbi:uncharacterized protein LOC108915572 [Anoplophora glabripennis]|uniref:uncharacterized protein LOC108915572 n=1 Tax=Anoplophora glabripennis TaxID=217634 RepID=UPI000C7855E5|nr:uncharacterized protein LOC108915572 [Anoplophora glabripennis]
MESDDQVGATTIMGTTCTTEEKTPECSKNWSNANTLLLIDLYKKYEQSFDTDLKKNIWHKITNDVNVKTGGLLSVTTVENKWKSLKRTYRSSKIKMDRSGSQKRYRQYFNAMDDILAKRPEITPPAIVSSSLGVVSQQPGTSAELTTSATESENVEESEENFFKGKML